ncbi:hypothetical protein FOZ62_029828, partial [Perkinsus olseni]
KLKVAHFVRARRGPFTFDILERDRRLIWECNNFDRYYGGVRRPDSGQLHVEWSCSLGADPNVGLPLLKSSFDKLATRRLEERILKAMGYRIVPFWHWRRVTLKSGRIDMIRMSRFIALRDFRERHTAQGDADQYSDPTKLGDILRTGPNENVLKIVNDVSSMHRVLMKSLSPKCVELIFSRVFVDFGSRFEARLLKEKDKVDDATVLESWRTSILADLGQMVVKLRPIADIRARMEASVKEMLSITDRILPPKDGEPPSGDILQLLDQAEDGPKSTSSSEEEAPADASTSPPAAAPAAAPAAGD